MRSLVVWGGGAAGPALARHRAGAEVLAWPGADTRPLAAAGVPVVRGEDRIGEEGRRAVEGAGRIWARLWSRVPLLDGRSFRELVTWGDTSLLWLTEAFVHRQTAGPGCARIVETALRLLDAARPDEIDAAGLEPPVATLLARACTARGVLFHGATPKASPLAPRPRPPVARWVRWRALLASTAGPDPGWDPPGPHASPPVVMFVGPTARDAEVDPIAAAVRARRAPVAVVNAALLDRWATRAVWREVGRATRMLKQQRERLRGAPGLQEAWAHRGVSFLDLARSDLDSILLGRLPAAVRLLETARSLMESTGPSAVALLGWPRDDRRGLLAATAQRGIPGVVVRTAPPDLDDVDREDGGPRPTATLEWTPGADPAPLVARLAEEARPFPEPA